MLSLKQVFEGQQVRPSELGRAFEPDDALGDPPLSNA
jgi:hypothetical protein